MVKLHTEAGEILTHSVIRCLEFHFPPRFYCIDHHQYLCSWYSWPLCWLNQSGNIWCGTHILLLWAFLILNAIVWLYIRFNFYLTIVFIVIWIIQFAIPVKPIFCERKAFRCAVFIAFDWMMVDSSDSADISCLSSSSRVVLCSHSWWQRGSFWQFKCSRTSMLTEWPGCFDDPFHVQNVSQGCHLLVFSARFLQFST